MALPRSRPCQPRPESTRAPPPVSRSSSLSGSHLSGGRSIRSTCITPPTAASDSPEHANDAAKHSTSLQQIKACLHVDRLRDDLCTVACNRIIEIPHLPASPQAALPGWPSISRQQISFCCGERPIEEAFFGAHLQIKSAFETYRCLVITKKNNMIRRQPIAILDEMGSVSRAPGWAD